MGKIPACFWEDFAVEQAVDQRRAIGNEILAATVRRERNVVLVQERRGMVVAAEGQRRHEKAKWRIVLTSIPEVHIVFSSLEESEAYSQFVERLCPFVLRLLTREYHQVLLNGKEHEPTFLVEEEGSGQEGRT